MPPRHSRGDGRRLQPRRQNVSQGTRESHSSRWATPNSPKESPARSSVSRFNGSAGPASARCPRASAGRLGPAAIQTEPTNKGPAAGGAGPPSGTGAGSPAVPRPTAVPPGGFSFLAFGGQASPGGARPSPRATRARPTAGGGPRTAPAQGCKPLRRAGLSACETRVKLSRPLQASPLTRRPRADGRGRPSNARRSGPAWPQLELRTESRRAAPSPARPLLGGEPGWGWGPRRQPSLAPFPGPERPSTAVVHALAFFTQRGFLLAAFWVRRSGP